MAALQTLPIPAGTPQGNVKSIEAQIAASLVGDNPALTPEVVTLLEQKWGAVDRRLVMGTSFGKHLLSIQQALPVHL